MSYSHFHFYFLVSYKKYFLCVPARPERFLLRTVVVVVVDIPRGGGRGGDDGAAACSS